MYKTLQVPLLLAENLFHCAAKRFWIDGRMAVEPRLDRGEVLTGSGRINQPSLDHLPYILEILAVAALDLGQGLRVKVEVVE